MRGYTSLGFSGPAPVRWIYNPAIDRAPTAPGAGAGQRADAPVRLPAPATGITEKGASPTTASREQVLTGDFPGGLKDLATERADVRAALTAVFARWIQAADFDGFRIDTLKHVEHEFWQYFCAAHSPVRGRQDHAARSDRPERPDTTVPPLSVPKKKFFMFGESFDGDDDLNGSYTQNQEVDSTFYFPQKFTVFDGVFKNGGPTSDIDDQFAAQAGELRRRRPTTTASACRRSDALVNFIDNHDVTRFLFDKPSLPALHNALAFLFTEDGIPCIYYGTEQEFSGGNDPDQPRAAVGHRLPHRRRHLPVDRRS